MQLPRAAEVRPRLQSGRHRLYGGRQHGHLRHLREGQQHVSGISDKVDNSCQTLFFNHRSLDLTLSDLSKSEPTVSPDKPMGQIWATSSSVFEAQSLTNSGKSLGIVWRICPLELPQANFSRQPLQTFHCLYHTLRTKYINL